MEAGKRSRMAEAQGSGEGGPALRPVPLALACGVLARERAALLLEGLAEPWRGEASRALEDFQAAGAATRQARLAAEFGLRPDAELRLRRLLSRVGPHLQAAVLAQLPPYLRSLLPTGAPAPEPAVEPAVDASSATRPLRTRLVERLVKEATR